MIDVWDGSVSGTVAYACRKRRPRAASALKEGVSMPCASGPIASARVVSSVTSRIEGRASARGAAVPGVGFEQPADAAAMATISSAAVLGIILGL